MSGLRSWYRAFRASLKAPELEELGDVLLTRPPAFILANVLRRTRVTPDQVSFCALLWSFVVLGCYAHGTTRAAQLGAAAFWFWTVLDCVDGQLARMKGQGSPIGYIVDQVVDQLSTVVLWVGITVGLVRGPGGGQHWWLIGTVAGVAMGMQCGVLEARRHEWMRRVLGTRKSISADLAQAVALAAEWRQEGRHLLGRFVVRFYQMQRWLQRIYARGANESDAVLTAAQDEGYARYHRKVLKLATWMGPSTQLVALMTCTFAGRVDLYVWAVLAVGVPWMLLVHALGAYASYQLRRAEASAR